MPPGESCPNGIITLWGSGWLGEPDFPKSQLVARHGNLHERDWELGTRESRHHGVSSNTKHCGVFSCSDGTIPLSRTRPADAAYLLCGEMLYLRYNITQSTLGKFASFPHKICLQYTDLPYSDNLPHLNSSQPFHATSMSLQPKLIFQMWLCNEDGIGRCSDNAHAESNLHQNNGRLLVIQQGYAMEPRADPKRKPHPQQRRHEQVVAFGALSWAMGRERFALTHVAHVEFAVMAKSHPIIPLGRVPGPRRRSSARPPLGLGVYPPKLLPQSRQLSRLIGDKVVPPLRLAYSSFRPVWLYSYEYLSPCKRTQDAPLMIPRLTRSRMLVYDLGPFIDRHRQTRVPISPVPGLGPEAFNSSFPTKPDIQTRVQVIHSLTHSPLASGVFNLGLSTAFHDSFNLIVTLDRYVSSSNSHSILTHIHTYPPILSLVALVFTNRL
ncbi:uncharacterized protein CLUP02_06962 [Colletotrichum lupini]|uniref:Uncharacterized protein n=1 Tax=Colletotrichum lupini TaxID=145971 RepID=A0A9Q8SRF3_9PEZI|nr:uncharacterized protein CLUP02_06962 [Colletotrichum lupini]UQC81476.1 hypothetical protein CLUP02_06962 [Colletotrichum lupini]